VRPLKKASPLALTATAAKQQTPLMHCSLHVVERNRVRWAAHNHSLMTWDKNIQQIRVVCSGPGPIMLAFQSQQTVTHGTCA